MNILLRGLVALMVGLFIGGAVNMSLVMLGPHVIPPPAGVDMSDAKSISASIPLLQPKHYLFPLLAHALGTLVGAMIAFLIVPTYRMIFSYAVGLIFLAGGLAAASMIPAPKWFLVLDLVGAYLPMAWLGGTLAARRLASPRYPA